MQENRGGGNITANSGLNQKLEKQVESQLVQLLETKCSELGVEIEEEKGLKKQQEIENIRLRTIIGNLEKVNIP